MTNSLTVLDIIVIITVLTASFRGFRTGFLPILIESTAIIGGILIALSYYVPVAAWLIKYLPILESVAVFVAFIAIWGSIVAMGIGVSRLIKPLLTLTMMRPLDRFGGALIGAARGFGILLPLLIPLSYTQLDIYHDSKLAKPLNALLYSRLPSIEKTSELLNNKLNKNPVKQVKKSGDIDKDLYRIQKALESGNMNQIEDLLEGE